MAKCRIVIAKHKSKKDAVESLLDLPPAEFENKMAEIQTWIVETEKNFKPKR